MTSMSFDMQNMTKVRLDILDHARLSGLNFSTLDDKECYVYGMIKKIYNGILSYSQLRMELNNLEVIKASEKSVKK